MCDTEKQGRIYISLVTEGNNLFVMNSYYWYESKVVVQRKLLGMSMMDVSMTEYVENVTGIVFFVYLNECRYIIHV